jgi:hypothetical protein
MNGGKTVKLLSIAVVAVLGASSALAAPPQAAPESLSPAAAPATKPVDAGERRRVVEDLAAALDANFVFPEIGARYAAMLRSKLTTGAYDSLADPMAFAEKVTADLQAVARDGHLRLALRSAFAERGPPPPNAALSTRASGPPGLEDAKMIGATAYLRFNEFPNEPGSAEAARRFLLAHADAKAVIIDARPNRGGGLAVLDAILPLLYPTRTTLVRTDTRASADSHGGMGTSATLVLQPSPSGIVRRDHVVIPDTAEARLQHVPVYYLISGRTASAAEHLALAFKRTHRAVLVGETTRGAGHFGGLMPIGDRFAAFIPVGRTYDPATNWDWEGRGVAPDVATPADAALDVALALAAKGSTERPRSP